MLARARCFVALPALLLAAGASACEPPCEKTLTCTDYVPSTSGQGGAGGGGSGGMTSAVGGSGGGSAVPTVVSISARYAATCVVLSDGAAYCWGGNTGGQLGLGHTDPVSTPQKVMLEASIQQIAIGGHTCAVSTDGATYCWGNNDYGELGLGIAGSPQSLPQLVTSLGAAEEVSVGDGFTCARLADTTVMCWGNGVFGKLGAGQIEDFGSLLPLPVVAFSQAASIATSLYHHACASKTDGSAWCWGRGSAGQLGDGQNMASSLPVPVFGLSDVAEVATGLLSSCARLMGGTVHCWGDWMSQPVLVQGLDGVTALEIGYEFACAITSGTVRCWGKDIRDPSGNGQLIEPEAISLPEAVVELATGNEHACAVGVSGNVYCWGSNEFDQLGNDEIVEHSAMAVLVDAPWSR